MNYNANDIVSLSAGRAFREKIGMYLSADRQEAINLGLRELIVNVQDEYEVYKPKNPFCKIELNTKTKTICVTDNMRGIPVGIRDDGMNSLTAAFLIPHSGGKHQEGAYSSAIGINGEGNKCVCHTAKWLEVEVKRDNKIYFQRFESNSEGAKAVTEVIAKEDNIKPQITGTKITYVADSEVYGNIFIDFQKLRQMLQELSYFTKGLKILLIIDGKEEVFYSANGLIDGLNSSNNIGEPFSYFYDTDDCKVELALQWVTDKGAIKGYANGLYMPDGGAFISSFKSSLTRTFNSLTKKNFDGEQIRNCLNGSVSVKVKMGQFSNQAKTALANKEAGTATSSAINSALKEYSKRYQENFEKVVEVLSKVQKAEAAADRARAAVINAQAKINTSNTKKTLMPEKLKDAEFLGEDSVLLICEGNSALAGLATARDVKKYGLLPIRGKIRNLLSCPLDEGLENEEVQSILYALGCGFLDKYNPNKLRYGKVGIAVDADSDGYHIACLIMALFQAIMPQFIEEGRLCWLRAPLYKVVKGKEKYYYFNDEELANGVKGEQTRYKGLGEMQPQDAQESMFNEKNQRLEVLIPDENSAMRLEDLMGSKVAPRKDFVFSGIIDFSQILD
jgi:DNA gyrase subunit B